MAINKVIYGENTLIDLTGDTVTADDLVSGKKAHDRSGTPITGTNPYAKSETDAEVDAQADLLEQALAALEGKAAGGGGGGGAETNTGMCTVTITPVGSTNHYICRETVGSDGTIEYKLSRSYTGSAISVTARCESTLIIMAANIKTMTISAGEMLACISGQGVVCRMPETDGTAVQIVLGG